MRTIRRDSKWTVTVCVTLAIGRVLSPSHAQRIDVIPTGADAEFCNECAGASLHNCALSEHFVVAHQIPDDALNQHLTTMEAAYRDVVRFLNAHGIDVPRVGARMRATFMPYRENRHEPRWVCGMTRTSNNWPTPPRAWYHRDYRRDDHRDQGYSWFALQRPPDDAGDSGRLTATVDRLTIRHEIAHQVLDHLVPTLNDRIPAWLAEGLACAFEPDGDDIASGPAVWNEWRAADAMERLNADDADAFLRALLTDAGTTFENPAADEAGRYAVAWALVSYAHHERPGAFTRLLRNRTVENDARGVGEGSVDPVTDLFGRLDANRAGRLVSYLTDASAARAHPSLDRPSVKPSVP